MEKPDVDFIEGLSPAIAIEQRSAGANPRSTIATTTEIYDYLRVLFSAVGQPHDPVTGQAITGRRRNRLSIRSRLTRRIRRSSCSRRLCRTRPASSAT
jgi:excinuclease UvrABC ATPase subunit